MLKYTLEGWPGHLDQSQYELKPYFNHKQHLSIEQGCILLGYRVIIPTKFHARLLDELHNDYPGVCKMKALARCYLWWPSLDKDIEAKAKSCFVCRAVQNAPQSAPLHPWTVHIDYAQKGGKNFLIIIDSYSKWLEVFEMKNTSAESTCDVLRTLFASFGLPEEVVSDNGSQFTSSVFKSFLSEANIDTAIPPSVEWRSRTFCSDFEEKFNKASAAFRRQTNYNSQAGKFLVHIPKHTTYKLLLHCFSNERLTLLHPNIAASVEKQQQNQQKYHDSANSKLREFKRHDAVQVKNFLGGTENGSMVLLLNG